VKKLGTLIRRELIEHRSSWAVTSVFGALFVLAALLAAVGLVRVGGMDTGLTLGEIAEDIDPEAFYPGLHVMLMSIAAILNVVMTFVVFFYLLDALYAERKDRSILFWKSLPVSDLQVVGAKYLTGVAAIPLLTLAVFLVTAVLVLLIGGLGLLWAGTGEALAAGPVALGASRCCSSMRCSSSRSGLCRSTAGCCWSPPLRSAPCSPGPSACRLC
jgi:ABC-2 type transport system permease protein